MNSAECSYINVPCHDVLMALKELFVVASLIDVQDHCWLCKYGIVSSWFVCLLARGYSKDVYVRMYYGWFFNTASSFVVSGVNKWRGGGSGYETNEYEYPVKFRGTQILQLKNHPQNPPKLCSSKIWCHTVYQLSQQESSFTILAYEQDEKCVHCAQANANHKNVPAQQISKVTCNT